MQVDSSLLLIARTGPQGSVQITGSSMFYGLLTVALNSMSQPTGRICDAPAHINAQLRISPIECSVDTLLMISRFLYHGSRRSFRHGAEVLITQRFFFDDTNPGHLHSLQRNSVFRGFLGVVTIYQSVKIFCSKNVFLTKVWAGCYIGHWLFGEILIYTKKQINLDQRQADVQHRIYSHGPGSTAWIVVTASALFPLHFGALGISGLAKSKGLVWSPIQCIGFVVIIFGCIPFIFASLYAISGRGNRTLRSFSTPLLAVVLPGVAYLIPLAIKSAAQLHDTHAHVLTATLAIVWASFGLVWAERTLHNLIANRDFARRLETWLAWWLVATHLVSAWLFYMYGYDTQKKNRPWWSEYLG